MTYFKAVRPDGTSFHDPSFRWLPADGVIPEGGWLVEHPKPAADLSPGAGVSAAHYLSVATVPTGCTGMVWPCRLLLLEAIGRAHEDDYYPSKRRIRAGRVVAELPATDALGPQGVHVSALIERCRSLTADEMDRAAWADAWWGQGATRGAAWDDAWEAARESAREAAWEAAQEAAWEAAQEAAWAGAWDAVRALLVRDLITPGQYDTLTRPWRLVVGPCHPDDGPIS